MSKGEVSKAYRAIVSDAKVLPYSPEGLSLLQKKHPAAKLVSVPWKPVSVRSNYVSRDGGDDGPRLLVLANRLGKFGLSHAARKVTDLERPSVREDKIDLGVQVGTTMFANVNENDSWQEANTLP